MPTHGPNFFPPNQQALIQEIRTALIQLCDYKPTPEYTSLREILDVECDENPLAGEYINLVGNDSLEVFLSTRQRCQSLVEHLKKFALFTLRDAFAQTNVEWSTGNLATIIANGIYNILEKRILADTKRIEAMEMGNQAIAAAQEEYDHCNYHYSRARYWGGLLQDRILPIAAKVSTATGQTTMPELITPLPLLPTHFQAQPPL